MYGFTVSAEWCYMEHSNSLFKCMFMLCGTGFGFIVTSRISCLFIIAQAAYAVFFKAYVDIIKRDFFFSGIKKLSWIT